MKSLGRLLLLGLLVAGCARAPDDVLRIGLATAPATLDPRFATDATSYRLCRLVYESLVDFDERYLPVPALARWARVELTRYRFFLPGGRRFHDGSPLTATDVVATYRSVLDPATASPHRGSLANVRAVRATGPLEVEFTLARPDPLFPGLLVIGILPAATARVPTASAGLPIGSGPFAAVAGPEPTRIRLRRVRDGQPIEFHVAPSETTRALRLARGELDLVQGGLTPEIAAWLERREGLSVRAVPGTTFTYLGFNLARGPTSDPRVRRAIAHAIDRDAIVQRLFRGLARPAQTVLVPEHWASHPDLPPIVHDPARARALLASAGYGPDRRLRLRYKISSDPFRLRLATVLQDQLARVGVELVIESYDWGTFYGDIKAGRFALFSLSWVGLQLPDIFRYAFHSASTPPLGANRGRYRSPAADRLIDQAEAAALTDARIPIYRDLQVVLLHDLPYVPLWYEDTVLVQRTRVVGYDTGTSGYYDGLANIQALRTDR